MSDLPPPPTEPSSGVPTPRPLPPRRPGVVTAAGTILIVAGALAIAGGFLLLSSEGDLAVPGLDGPDVARVAAVIVFFVAGALEVLTGWLVFRLSPAGRVLGIVIAVIGLLGGLAQLRESGFSGLLQLALYAFVLYGLLAYGFVFRDASAAR